MVLRVVRLTPSGTQLKVVVQEVLTQQLQPTYTDASHVMVGTVLVTPARIQIAPVRVQERQPVPTYLQ